MRIESTQPIQHVSCYRKTLNTLRYCYDKVKELAIKIFDYIASLFNPRYPIPELKANIIIMTPKPILLLPDVSDIGMPGVPAPGNVPNENQLNTDDFIERTPTPEPPPSPISITSAVELRLKQDSPDTIIREVLESMSVTPPEERITITITPPETIHRISPTASVASIDSTGWVIDPI